MQYLNKDSPIQGLSSLPTDLPEDWPMAWSAWASASDPPTQRPRPQPVPRTHRGNLCAAASWCCCRAGRRIQGQNVGKKLYIVKMWGLNSSEPCWSEVLIPYIYIDLQYIYIIIIIYPQNIEDSWDVQWPCKSNWYTKSNWKHDCQRFSWPSLVLGCFRPCCHGEWCTIPLQVVPKLARSFRTAWLLLWLFDLPCPNRFNRIQLASDHWVVGCGWMW